MSRKTIARFSEMVDPISQGDIFKEVRYNYIDSENDTDVNIVEYTFPLAIIVSQACDVIAMEETLIKNDVRPSKFMPGILMCPIYDSTDVTTGKNIEQVYDAPSNVFSHANMYFDYDREVAGRDWHYRFHVLDVEVANNMVLENTVIDFKHYFTVPMSYLCRHKDDRLFHLEDIFAEQVTLKFTVFLSRVAIP